MEDKNFYFNTKQPMFMTEFYEWVQGKNDGHYIIFVFKFTYLISGNQSQLLKDFLHCLIKPKYFYDIVNPQTNNEEPNLSPKKFKMGIIFMTDLFNFNVNNDSNYLISSLFLDLLYPNNFDQIIPGFHNDKAEILAHYIRFNTETFYFPNKNTCFDHFIYHVYNISDHNDGKNHKSYLNLSATSNFPHNLSMRDCSKENYDHQQPTMKPGPHFIDSLKQYYFQKHTSSLQCLWKIYTYIISVKRRFINLDDSQLDLFDSMNYNSEMECFVQEIYRYISSSSHSKKDIVCDKINSFSPDKVPNTPRKLRVRDDTGRAFINCDSESAPKLKSVLSTKYLGKHSKKWLAERIRRDCHSFRSYLETNYEAKKDLTKDLLISDEKLLQFLRINAQLCFEYRNCLIPALTLLKLFMANMRHYLDKATQGKTEDTLVESYLRALNGSFERDKNVLLCIKVLQQDKDFISKLPNISTTLIAPSIEVTQIYLDKCDACYKPLYPVMEKLKEINETINLYNLNQNEEADTHQLGDIKSKLVSYIKYLLKEFLVSPSKKFVFHELFYFDYDKKDEDRILQEFNCYPSLDMANSLDKIFQIKQCLKLNSEKQNDIIKPKMDSIFNAEDNEINVDVSEFDTLYKLAFKDNSFASYYIRRIELNKWWEAFRCSLSPNSTLPSSDKFKDDTEISLEKDRLDLILGEKFKRALIDLKHMGLAKPTGLKGGRKKNNSSGTKGNDGENVVYWEVMLISG
ncbi:uncharacterized protein LOC135924575 [Gordionus sp. m RMFG-2023]|uniref:uncharacterized protein LOC135924575 n=1 Tax=Gordionus sp. m RMFG-2023 TaxID=3053472 RepID=UPI0031FCB442